MDSITSSSCSAEWSLADAAILGSASDEASLGDNLEVDQQITILLDQGDRDSGCQDVVASNLAIGSLQHS